MSEFILITNPAFSQSANGKMSNFAYLPTISYHVCLDLLTWGGTDFSHNIAGYELIEREIMHGSVKSYHDLTLWHGYPNRMIIAILGDGN